MNKKFRITFIIVILLSSIVSTSVFATTRYSTNPDECVDGVCYVPQQDDETICCVFNLQKRGFSLKLVR